jgi:RNA polymerase sigma factor (TIGR02999 family)
MLPTTGAHAVHPMTSLLTAHAPGPQLSGPTSATAPPAPAAPPPPADPAALFQKLYTDLRRMARRELWRHGGGMTLGATTLLHEAYLGLSQSAATLAFPDAARFMAYTSRTMRGLIVDHARARQAQKRGGLFVFTQLDTQANQVAAEVGDAAGSLEAVNDAVEELARVAPKLAELVDLKFFGGLTFAEIAALREVTERTVQRDWAKARAALRLLLQPANNGVADPPP